MQHLDEGTIHSWLDGALSADDAARVEAHVAECPQCATAVAEARGFIAASSRILTALDHVPRGVVPAASPVRWYNRAAWRAAAAVLVVAVGSLVVVRNGVREAAVSPTMIDSAGASQAAVTQPQIVEALPAATPARKSPGPPSGTPSTQSAPASRVASSGKPTAEGDYSGKPARGAKRSNIAARELGRDEAVDAAIAGNAASAPLVAGAVTASPQSAVSSHPPGAVMMDSAGSEQPRLKVVGTPRMIGAKVTLYEVAPGDTVTFTEVSNLHLESVVTTGISAAEPQARRSVQKSAATPRTQTASPAAVAPPPEVEVANGMTSISWPDVATGNMLRLSGRMSVERLNEIKRRIQRERAAAAKRNP